MKLYHKPDHLNVYRIESKLLRLDSLPLEVQNENAIVNHVIVKFGLFAVIRSLTYK